MAQLVTRIDDSLLGAVDALVDREIVSSRSDAVRRALEAYVDRVKRDLIGEALVVGYSRIPPDDDLWSDRDTARMITEEPW
ncbi:MAG: hypothetical protein DCC49_06370 [Acidobacteria bacterium]|nr:MAG: hypothetical protein DCC49_06370 [Acidobacteriota bacterium]